MSVVAHLRLRTRGKSGLRIGRHAQCELFRSSRGNFATGNATGLPLPFENGSPIFTHFVRIAISPAGSFDLGGISNVR